MTNVYNKLKEFIQRLINDYLFRAKLTMICSIIADFVLCIYYIVVAFCYSLFEIMIGLSVLNILLAFVRLNLFIQYNKNVCDKTLYITNAISLFLLGSEMFSFLFIIYFTNANLIIPSSTLFINGSALCTFAFSFMGRKYFFERHKGTFYRCKKYLSQISGLSALIIILQRIFCQYLPQNKYLYLSVLLSGIFLLGYSLVLCIIQIVHACKTCEHNA